jgi:hypothetical protein
MPPTRRFWRALQSIPGAATSRFEWQALLGEEGWRLAAPLLRPTGALVTRVRCPSPGGDGCPRRVVRHGSGRIVAVCGDLEGQCDPVELALDDIVVHELDVETLAEALCKLLGLERELRTLPVAGAAWQIGWYVPVAGQRFAVTLILPVGGEQAHHSAVRLRAYYDRPFLLLVPTRTIIEPATVEFLRAGRSRLLCLEEMLGVGTADNWQLLPPAEDLLRDFRHDVIGDVRFGMPEHQFPTPPGSCWSDVTIRFINGHEVEPRVRGQGGGVFSYAHMGMAKTNKDEPTVQWDLLRNLAENHGELLWPRAVARKTVQKQRERLANHLRDFFVIDDYPFEDLPGRRGFKTRFVVVPER